MTLHTPVVLTNDPHATAEAHARRWKVVARRDDGLHVTGCEVTMPSPQQVCDIVHGSFSAEHAQGWEAILDWLADHIHRPMLVVAPLDPLTDLALWARATRGWPLAALVTSPAPAATPSTVALLTGGEGVIIPDENVASAFRSRWPAPCPDLPTTPLVRVSRHRPTTRSGGPPANGIKVLLVGYYAGPCPTVGVQRINYWFEQLSALSDGRIVPDLAVATPWPDAPANVHRVPDLAAASLALRTGRMEPEDARVLAEHEQAAYPITKQVAGFWNRALEHHFDGTDDHYDVVICSGNPFPYLAFAQYARARWGAMTINDYRDPFARSPRMQYTDAARRDAEELEAEWNAHADVVTVVNDVCAHLVVKGVEDQRIEVIPNGFDDRTPIPAPRERPADGPSRFVNAGQLFAITPPDELLQALSATESEFHQIGAPVAKNFGATVINHGRMQREEVLAELTRMDCGVAYVTMSGLETPTKVFDYLAAGLDILVLHRGAAETSALASMLDGVTGVHWVLDEKGAISDFLAGYAPTSHIDRERSSRFSRRHSTLELIELIDELLPRGGCNPNL